ncbi:MAG TPA: sodium:proton antiporter [Candidatus Aenigmarchaeota archaeon]|nr:sodium:proton antiporter [Candidatus Aenigmarchaeota archaeon]
MSVIVKTVACILTVPAYIFGLYIVIRGHLTPGGGFAGGAILATLIAMLLVSFGRNLERGFRKESLSVLEILGMSLFITLAFFGLSFTFFHNILANSGGLFGMSVEFGPNSGYLNTGGLIPVMNIAVGIEVFSALSMIILLMLTGMKEEKK